MLSYELEEFDYTLLYQVYSAKGRNPAVDPKTMFIDGTKLEACANKYTLVRKNSVGKWEETYDYLETQKQIPYETSSINSMPKPRMTGWEVTCFH